ncbi:aminotransferase class I/II-fold pyridoxal phosphate-dependent enzyme [Pasteuria penetrans]|uniref:aminotransferase class I/II-fold pyridoxal phosphate-dependent enzyme n=1 Tax=Pasteuria penetrans TaxID=86005 RepID=UPI000F9F1B16|nr:8-amino-7-oxononanoate synthase [Pasteuria penetrans]
MAGPEWEHWIEKQRENWEIKQQTRFLVPTEQATAPFCRRDGRTLLNLSSTNYLGLAHHPKIRHRFQQPQNCVGTTSSRLLLGHNPPTTHLEEQLAHWLGKEAALLFANGYMANLGILSSLLTRRDAVFMDKASHASLLDGARLSGAHLYRYRHGDWEHLIFLLQRAGTAGRKMIVTESLFSMEGDMAPLPELMKIAEKWKAALLVDEAHAVGVYGPRGQGWAWELGIEGGVDLAMGTFSKALGSYGAYVAGPSSWLKHLQQTCRSLVYTVSLPPALIAANQAALSIVARPTRRMGKLHQRSIYFRSTLGQHGITLPPTAIPTPIVPIPLRDSQCALGVEKKLVERGILAMAIRPPTVPAHRVCIRCTVMATHTMKSLQGAATTIAEVIGP